MGWFIISIVNTQNENNLYLRKWLSLGTVSNVTQGLIHTLHMFLSLHVHNIMFLMFFYETCNCVYPFTFRRNKTVFIPVLPVRPSLQLYPAHSFLKR